MQAIKEQDWQMLPEFAQEEIYSFFLMIKQRYEQQTQRQDNYESVAKSKINRISRLNELKVDAFVPISRDDIYAR